jgi:uncharacterized protein involved in exopolysaccharide biosynthesis
MTTENSVKDEIDFFDLFMVLLRHKWMIISITLCTALVVLGLSIVSLKLPPEKSFMPNVYSPKALMLINNSSSGNSLSSMLSSSGLSSLMNLSGLASSGNSYSSLAVYLTSSNRFLDAVAAKFDIAKKYHIDKNVKTGCRTLLKGKIKTEIDGDSGVLSISFTDIDPVFAQSVTNFCVEYLEFLFDDMNVDKNKLNKINLEVNIKNTYDDIVKLQKDARSLEYSVSVSGENKNLPSIMQESSRLAMELAAKQSVYTQLKTQYELLKVSMASESPVFQVLEYAEVPDQKSGPSRGKFCVIATFVAFFLSIVLSFILNAFENTKRDPLLMEKMGKVHKT